MPQDSMRYAEFSRFTEPQDFDFMLNDLPDDIPQLCQIAQQQIVHHNLLPYFDIPRAKWGGMAKVWPPKMSALLEALKNNPPHTLQDTRPIEQRIVAACFVESHFLAGLLRSRGIPARCRAGYFKDIRGNNQHVIDFWNMTLKAKGVLQELLDENPDEWDREVNTYTAHMNEINHYIEHWVLEYWDEDQWRILDADTTFLKASGGIEVDIHLPRTHYEFAHEAWHWMRTVEDFLPERYAEEPQDGRAHIRKSMLLDFYSLLNHDRVEDEDSIFMQKEFIDLAQDELDDLDRLAELLSGQPSIQDLIDFYHDAATLRLASVEDDPYSFIQDML